MIVRDGYKIGTNRVITNDERQRNIVKGDTHVFLYFYRQS